MQYSLTHIKTNTTIPVRRTGQGIRCSGAYSGYCDFNFSGGVVTIHTISAAPQGSGLGAALVKITAIEGTLNGCFEVEALATAQDALGFYLKSGFLPQNPQANGTASYNLAEKSGKDAFELRVLGRYRSATWAGKTNTILRRVEELTDGVWDLNIAP